MRLKDIEIGQQVGYRNHATFGARVLSQGYYHMDVPGIEALADELEAIRGRLSC